MVARQVLGSAPFRATTWAAIHAARALVRLASFLRARALFPQSPDLVLACTTEVKYPERVTMGRRVIIGPHCTIGAAAPVFIGDDVHVSKGVMIETGYAEIDTLPPYLTVAKPIRIEDGVWLGARAIVLGGVTVGRNSVVAAGAVVRKNVPPDTVVSTTRPESVSLAGLDRKPR